MSLKPCVLVLSSTSTKPKSLIKLITKSCAPIINNESSSSVSHSDWFIDSKYYTAEIHLTGVETDFKRNEEFNKCVEGMILIFEPNSESGLKDLNVWDSIQNDCDPDIKILVANYCNEETKITRSKAVEWCLKRGFELVELYPTKIDESESDEKLGVERIIEILHTHTWSNLCLKSDKTSFPQAQLESKDFHDDFTDVFSQLHLMRENLSSLPTNQRKQCAEQMVTAFWKAIGGDEDELLDV